MTRPLLATGMLALFAAAVAARAIPPTTEKHTMHASGTFVVKLEPQPPAVAASALGRMTIDKQFSGDLEAHSLGEMLAFRSAVDGSAGYVAMERVTGALHGRKGSFVLQHSGTMDRGASTMQVTVVPDSGTDELAGLTGALTIRIEGGQHYYTFDYTLP